MCIITPDQLGLLKEVASLLHIIGSANDAEDHSFLKDANQMRKDARSAIEKLLNEEPDLSVFLPGLSDELTTGHIFGSGWSELLDAIEGQLESTDK